MRQRRSREAEVMTAAARAIAAWDKMNDDNVVNGRDSFSARQKGCSCIIISLSLIMTVYMSISNWPDVNKDGKVDYDDLVARDIAFEAHLAQLAMDTNGDGSLNVKEIASAIHTNLDVDGDGTVEIEDVVSSLTNPSNSFGWSLLLAIELLVVAGGVCFYFYRTFCSHGRLQKGDRVKHGGKYGIISYGPDGDEDFKVTYDNSTTSGYVKTHQLQHVVKCGRFNVPSVSGVLCKKCNSVGSRVDTPTSSEGTALVLVKIAILGSFILYLVQVELTATHETVFGQSSANPMINLEASIDDVGVPITLSWSDLSVNRTISDTLTITTIQPNSGTMEPGTVCFFLFFFFVHHHLKSLQELLKIVFIPVCWI